MPRCDRDSLYCLTTQQLMLIRHKLKCSMSAKGSCYSGISAENSFLSLKAEAIHGWQFDQAGYVSIDVLAHQAELQHDSVSIAQSASLLCKRSGAVLTHFLPWLHHFYPVPTPSLPQPSP